MKLFIALLLTISTSSSSAASVRGKKVRNKEFPELREGDVQNLCDSDKTFELGDDDCVISFDLDDLDPTSSAHIFHSHACGDKDPIIVTMDLEDEMPWYAARLNHRTNEWSELSELPDVPEYGCMYTTVTNLGDTHNMVHDDQRDDGERRELGIDSEAVPLDLVDRELEEATCSEYRVVRLAILYDARFCTDHGKGTTEGSETFINTIVEMMNPFFNVAPLCIKVEACSIEGSCSEDDDVYGDMKRSSTSVCEDKDENNFLSNLIDMYPEGPREGCDTTQLFVAGPPYPNDTDGCAEMAHLCDSKAVGISFMDDRPLFIYVWLASHELGHNLEGYHAFGDGEDEYIMSYGYKPDRFGPSNIGFMVDFVKEKHAEDSTCTRVESASIGDASCSGHEFDLELQTDEHGEEISWKLEDPNGIVVAEGGYYPEGEKSFVEVTKCLSSDGEYTFKIMDSCGDGMEGDDAYYTLWYDGNVVVDYGGGFGSGESIAVPGDNNE